MYVAFFIGILLALGLDSWWVTVRERRRQGAVSAPWYAQGPRRTALRIGGAVVVLAAVVGLLPRWPYRSFPVQVNAAQRVNGLRMIPDGAVVLAYPYPTSFDDEAMLWQALDGMRFQLLGGYALVRGERGTATVFPRVLQPSLVEAMLINSVTPVPDPHLPDLVATERTVVATRVVALARGAAPPNGAQPAVVGRIGSFLANGTFYIEPNHYQPVQVEVSAATHFIDAAAHNVTFASVLRDRRIAVYGRVTAGTVTPAMITGLRKFLVHNHVQSVIVGLGVTDGWVVGQWVKAAIGRPSRAGQGGLLWADVPRSLAKTP
jgi:hypothetical protein